MSASIIWLFRCQQSTVRVIAAALFSEITDARTPANKESQDRLVTDVETWVNIYVVNQIIICGLVTTGMELLVDLHCITGRPAIMRYLGFASQQFSCREGTQETKVSMSLSWLNGAYMRVHYNMCSALMLYLKFSKTKNEKMVIQQKLHVKIWEREKCTD